MRRVFESILPNLAASQFRNETEIVRSRRYALRSWSRDVVGHAVR